jgi:hypothetical protein
MASGGRVLSAITSWTSRAPKPKARNRQPAKSNGVPLRPLSRFQPRAQRAKSRGVFPRILDEYVVREFLNMFLLVLAGFVMLMLVFTFFDLVGDILRNHIPLTIVGDYLVNLTPSMLYQIAPLAVLIAVLVTFGVLNRNSEIIAMKATGISLYRLVVPIVSIAAILAVSLFLFDEYYLPQANRGRRRCATSSRAARRRPSCIPSRSGSSASRAPASPAASSTTSSSIPTATSSPTSRSSSSIPPPSRSRGASLPPAPSGIPKPDSWRFQNGWQRDIQGANVTGVSRIQADLLR